jgi:hypothetical protein
MCGAVTAQVLEMNGIVEPASRVGLPLRIARLVSDRVHDELSSTVREHFWHEWHAIQPTPLIEGGQNLCIASHFYEVAGLELRK